MVYTSFIKFDTLFFDVSTCKTFVSKYNTMENKVIEGENPTALEATNTPAHTPTKPTPGENESWVKTNGKMTTSLPPNIQTIIREMAPSNVLNISQFITWILQAYQAQTIENTALQENQDILNHKLKESYDELKTLGSENAELGHSLAALRAKSTTIETPPAPTNPAIKEKPNYLSYLGL